jgi:hypothetical protein
MERNRARRARRRPLDLVWVVCALVLGLAAGASQAPAVRSLAQSDEIRMSLDELGRLTLRGVVRDGETRRFVGELARVASGGRPVRNELVVEPRQGGELVRDSLQSHEVIEARARELAAEPGAVGPGALSGPRAGCLFSNPAHAGWCIETVPLEAGESCAQACGEVLRCLSDPLCVGLYCGASDLRIGWRLELVVGPETPWR